MKLRRPALALTLALAAVTAAPAAPAAPAAAHTAPAASLASSASSAASPSARHPLTTHRADRAGPGGATPTAASTCAWSRAPSPA